MRYDHLDFEQLIGEIETNRELLGELNPDIGQAIIIVRRNSKRYLIYHYHQPERSKREDLERGCGALNNEETH